MVGRNLAVVLGGGGAAGNAWLIGIVAGMAEAGVDLTDADLVVGTSAGATAAAQLRSGTPPAELLAAILAPPVRTGGARPPAPPSLPMAEVFDRMRAIGAAASSAEEVRRAMGAFGLEADTALGPTAAAERRAMVAARLPRAEWPDRPMILVAVNAHSGALAAFDRESGVELADAVTASTASPGLAPTHEIGSARYISGGARSTHNADLAAGYADVVILSPLGGRGATLPEGQFEGLRRLPGAGLEDEIATLRQRGSRVTLITPDAASREAMGTNQMDFATRVPSARAGLAQGREEAGRLTLA